MTLNVSTNGHLQCVAKRRACKLKEHGEKKERRVLAELGWSQEEIERMIKIERRTEK